jgi:hypothetical protein
MSARTNKTTFHLGDVRLGDASVCGSVHSTARKTRTTAITELVRVAIDVVEPGAECEQPVAVDVEEELTV